MDKQSQRTIFIGDIHGCFDEFIALLKKLDYRSKTDRLISLGDLVNKGPKSAQVLDYFINNDIEAVKGNHDDWLLRALLDRNNDFPGLDKILRQSQFTRKQLINWLESMPLYIKDKEFIAVHAGLSPYCKLKENSPREMFTMRYADPEKKELISKNNGLNQLVAWYEEYAYLKKGKREIIHGHWAKKTVCEYGRITGLDTGCVYGGKLTAYVLPDKQFVQVSSQQEKQYDY